MVNISLDLLFVLKTILMSFVSQISFLMKRKETFLDVTIVPTVVRTGFPSATTPASLEDVATLGTPASHKPSVDFL